ncbi:conserved hypothetical protein [Theileria orientalis strain Shintoku]|uniref:Uncharacterized protein n=1 Tax=Theileria orientalis strain Shintoku TaxID=869250 RepID=J4CDD9_THEOR|nr:conserved hypothetical protein [Theileria orientalis strain Shintoku]PVC52207.1 hypothetical protein MACL_00000946 [Theileria orientalis]BAM40972.1 conserved hypothetical protein [Theileria orientalis strain Shintoku]|eukprot:XP_009691273.1 conserved hypothetical protein [Theileria orientalis strain Shintoku]
MLLGSSSLIDLSKSSNTSNDKELTLDNKSHLLIIDDSIKPLNIGNSYEIISLPSPNNVYNKEYYLIGENRLFRLNGIKPNENRVSLFLNEFLANPEFIIATFEFDVIFIFISILYLNKDKYITMSSRIVDCYTNSSSAFYSKSLQSSVLSIWSKNVNDVKTRLMYLCDVSESHGGNEHPLRPNEKRLRHLLTFKVNKMVNHIISNNLFISDYCETSVTSTSPTVRKNLVTLNEDKCRHFCWSLVKSHLSETAAKILIPSEITGSLVKPVKNECTPQVLTSTATKRAKVISGSKGTPSITSFFKAK